LKLGKYPTHQTSVESALTGSWSMEDISAPVLTSRFHVVPLSAVLQMPPALV